MNQNDIKPIFTVGIPLSYTLSQARGVAIELEAKLLEYHVVVYQCKSGEPKFDLYSVDSSKKLSTAQLRLIEKIINKKI